MSDRLTKTPLQGALVYRKRSTRSPTSTTSSTAVSGVESPDDLWEQFKRAGTPKDDGEDIRLFTLGSMPRPPILNRAKTVGRVVPPVKNNLRSEFQAAESEPLGISKEEKTIPSSSSSSVAVLLPVKRKSPTSAYDFDAEDDDIELGSSQGLSSSQGSSSQGSNASTGSAKAPPRKKIVSAHDGAFRKPAAPPAGMKARATTRATTRVPPAEKGESYPPGGQKRPQSQASVMERPNKISSPDKAAAPSRIVFLPTKPSDAMPSSSSLRSLSKPTTAALNGQVAKTTTITGKTADAAKVTGSVASATTKKPSAVPLPVKSMSMPTIMPVRNNTDVYDHRGEAEWRKEILGLTARMKTAPANTVAIRCDSTVKLARKLLDPSFRTEFARVVSETDQGVFDLLADASAEPNLALSLAAAVLVLSADTSSRMVMKNATTLRLMARIIGQGAATPEKLNGAVVEGVLDVVGRCKLAPALAKEPLTAPRLMLEALITMKLSGHYSWFLDEIRHQGLIEHLIKHFSDTVARLTATGSFTLLISVHKISEFFYRCMHTNKENSIRLVSACDFEGLTAVYRAIKFCVAQFLKASVPAVDVRTECGKVLRSLLSLLVNLTGHADLLRVQMLEKQPNLMRSLIQACFDLNGHLPQDKAQEILIRAILCIVNFTFNCEKNCEVFLKVDSVFASKRPNLVAFVELLKKTSDEAVTSGNALDRYTEQYGRMIQAIEKNADVTITDVLDKAGENMEHYAIMCYDGLLLGHLVTQSEGAQVQLKKHFATVFGDVSTAVTVAADAIKRMTDFITDAKAENVHPLSEMQAAVDALEAYGYRNSAD
ncbi:hypothetical protein BV898_15433 [Hypsibius exemplaris]|uniref:Wings apart-like protein C-terminal domain-containing protein n=1 Tax=Hypsibius exemplaris TaxID=2072580 RepID=A0A9X6RKH2_HYPEX|nr:hypothetical protein BV898_15433 [Hypsibius exemplaris]